MSLGDTNNNKQGGKYYPTVYAGTTFYNDNAALNFKYVLSGILEMRIVPKVNGTFDDKSGISMFISPNKAVVLSQAITLLKEAIKNDSLENYGVCSNKKNGNVEFGYNTLQEGGIQLYATIYKYGNNGAISDSATFVFVSDEYVIKNFSPNDCSYDSIPVNDVPLTIIKTLLDEYVKAMTGAGAYGVEYHVGQYKYNVGSLKKMLENGGGNGGLPAPNNNYSNNSGGNSIFGNGGNSNSGNSTSNFATGDLYDLE